MFEIEVFCGGLFQTNGYLVTTDTCRILFDAPEGIARWAKSKGETLDGLVLTHLHHDHIIDAAKVKETFGCEIWSHSEPCDDLTLASRLEQMMGIPCHLDEFSSDHLLKDQETLSFGDLEMDILSVPGHSPDSLCFRLGDHPFLVGGDVLFRGGIGRTDFPHGDHETLLSGIRERLWPLDDDTQVLPGHGPPTTIGMEKATNPFLA